MFMIPLCCEMLEKLVGMRIFSELDLVNIGFPSHPPFPHSSYEVILHFKGFLLIVLVPRYGTGKVR